MQLSIFYLALNELGVSLLRMMLQHRNMSGALINHTIMYNIPAPSYF